MEEGEGGGVITTIIPDQVSQSTTVLKLHKVRVAVPVALYEMDN